MKTITCPSHIKLEPGYRYAYWSGSGVIWRIDEENAINQYTYDHAWKEWADCMFSIQHTMASILKIAGFEEVQLRHDFDVAKPIKEDEVATHLPLGALVAAILEAGYTLAINNNAVVITKLQVKPIHELRSIHEGICDTLKRAFDKIVKELN